jgi:hypothetical protein
MNHYPLVVCVLLLGGCQEEDPSAIGSQVPQAVPAPAPDRTLAAPLDSVGRRGLLSPPARAVYQIKVADQTNNQVLFASITVREEQ